MTYAESLRAAVEAEDRALRVLLAAAARVQAYRTLGVREDARAVADLQAAAEAYLAAVAAEAGDD